MQSALLSKDSFNEAHFPPPSGKHTMTTYDTCLVKALPLSHTHCSPFSHSNPSSQKTVMYLSISLPDAITVFAMLRPRFRGARSGMFSGIIDSCGNLYLLLKIQLTASIFAWGVWYACPHVLLWPIAWLLNDHKAIMNLTRTHVHIGM